MDLGIRGRKAIVCASSQGLGKGCALALAEAGVSVVINGRDRPALESAAQELRATTGADVTTVAADVSTREGQQALLSACPAPDILINNNGGPPFRDFRELDREALIKGVAKEEGVNEIRANSILVGVIDAGQFKVGQEAGTFTPEWEAAVKAMLPLKRWGTPEDIGQAAVFFAGRRGNYVTGQTIAVAGGFGV